MANAIDRTLVLSLEAPWRVEIMPKRYNSERIGATPVGSDDGPSAPSSSPRPLRYKFRVLVFQDGELDEEVETPVYEFKDMDALTSALLTFAARNSAFRLRTEVMNLWEGQVTILPPNVQQDLGPATTLVIKEIVRVS